MALRTPRSPRHPQARVTHCSLSPGARQIFLVIPGRAQREPGIQWHCNALRWMPAPAFAGAGYARA
jgi:hypothetical protein